MSLTIFFYDLYIKLQMCYLGIIMIISSLKVGLLSLSVATGFLGAGNALATDRTKINLYSCYKVTTPLYNSETIKFTITDKIKDKCIKYINTGDTKSLLLKPTTDPNTGNINPVIPNTYCVNFANGLVSSQKPGCALDQHNTFLMSALAPNGSSGQGKVTIRQGKPTGNHISVEGNQWSLCNNYINTGSDQDPLIGINCGSNQQVDLGKHADTKTIQIQFDQAS